MNISDYLTSFFALYFVLPIFWYFIASDDKWNYAVDLEANVVYCWLVSIFYFDYTHGAFFIYELAGGTILSVIAYKVFIMLKPKFTELVKEEDEQ
jgi:hypothetical protein